MLADAMIRWTARMFVACYVVRLWIDANGHRGVVSQQRARLFWTMGCIIFVIHVLLAFHLVHGWSHQAAYDHVMKRTQELTGVASGVGLYVNYAFGVIWITDTLIWWRRLDWSEKRVPYWIAQGVFAFLFIQATVVFGPWFWTPICAIVVLMLVALWWTRQ